LFASLLGEGVKNRPRTMEARRNLIGICVGAP